MDYSRVSLTDAVAGVLIDLRNDLAREMHRILLQLDAIRRDPSKTHAEKQLATLQHDAAMDALEWALKQADKYFTPIGGDGS